MPRCALRGMLCLWLWAAMCGWAASPEQPAAPGARPAMPAADHDHDGADLDELAWQPSRPTWAPLPLLRSEVGMTSVLHELLKSRDAVVRARAALLLGQIASPASVQPLRRAQYDVDRTVRVHAGIALACMGEQRGVAACRAALRSEAPWVRYYAAYGLWRVDTDRARAALRDGLHGQGELVRTAIEGALDTPVVAPPPVTPLPPGADVGPPPALQDLWEQAADVFIRESDWWWHKGDYEQVIRASEVSVFLDPEYVDTHTVVAWLQWSLGRNTEAIGTLHRAVRIAPGDPESHFGLGHHYFNLRRYALAEEPLRRAVELGGDHLAQRSHAHCLERLGKVHEARERWAALLKQRPDDGSVIRNYERLQRMLEGKY